jgi:predicted PurR-regulated permease PerM
VAGDSIELHVPFSTLIKIALAILLISIVVKLFPIILMLVVAVWIAVMLDPIPTWLEGHHVRRSVSIIALALIILGILVAFFVLVVPTVSGQVAELSKQWPQVEQRLTRAFPPAGPLLQSLHGGGPQTRSWLVRGMSAGKFAIEGTTTIVFVLVFAIYLLHEGRRAYSWLVDFAPKQHRRRIAMTAEEIRAVVLAYMRGSIITATICAIYVFVVLTALRVPLALLLAVLAFIFDFIPVVGTIIMAVPATLLGLLVSPGRALLVLTAYLLYHALEAYVFIPGIWGREMQVSTLTVLLAIAIGGTLLGAIGAVLALPIAAAYPIVERIWLREHLASDTVERHEELDQTQT